MEGKGHVYILSVGRRKVKAMTLKREGRGIYSMMDLNGYGIDHNQQWDAKFNLTILPLVL